MERAGCAKFMSVCRATICASLDTLGSFLRQSHGRPLDRNSLRARRRDRLRILDDRFPGRPARHGCQGSALSLAPIIASYFKMIVPLIVILPGLLALAVFPSSWFRKAMLAPDCTATTKCCRLCWLATAGRVCLASVSPR